ncbi:MAG: hypothetical protein R6U96_17090 [Promethearchaeia archaeon]
MTVENNKNEISVTLDQKIKGKGCPTSSYNLEEREVRYPRKKTEKETMSDPKWLDKKSFRFTIMAIFTALIIVLGFLLIYIPNIQLVFIMLFLSGFIMGKKDGAVIGLMSSFLFCFFNPMGASPLPLLVFQIVYYASIALIGGFMKDFIKDKPYFQPQKDLYKLKVILLFGSTGGLLTFIFDISTTMIHALFFFGTLEAFWPTYLIGISFTTVHLIANILLFIFVLPVLIQTIYKMLDL